MWCSCIMVPPQKSWPTSDLQKRSIPPVVFYKGIPCHLTSLSCWSTAFSDTRLWRSLVYEDGSTLKPANGCRHPAVTLTALAYASDVAITSDSASGAERTLRRLQFHSEAIEFKLNAAKTKALHVGYESDPKPILTLDGMTIDVCDIHNYLGLPTLSSKVVIRQRFAAVWSAIGKLCPMFHLTAPDAMKIKLFKSAVKTIAACALESLPLNPTTSNMLDVSNKKTRSMIRTALSINWQNNITNEEAYSKSCLLPFSQTIRKEDFAWSATRCVFRIDLPHHSGQCCKTLTSYSRYAMDRAERGLWRRICSTIWTQLTATMLLTSVQVSLLTLLIRSTPIFIVEEHLNNNLANNSITWLITA